MLHVCLRLLTWFDPKYRVYAWAYRRSLAPGTVCIAWDYSRSLTPRTSRMSETTQVVRPTYCMYVWDYSRSLTPRTACTWRNPRSAKDRSTTSWSPGCRTTGVLVHGPPQWPHYLCRTWRSSLDRTARSIPWQRESVLEQAAVPDTLCGVSVNIQFFVAHFIHFNYDL